MIQPTMRPSNTLILVSQALMENPSGYHYGYSLTHVTGLLSGSVYPTLRRMSKVGWLTVRWEAVPPDGLGRPARCFHRLTPEGREAIRALLTEAKHNPRFAPLFA